jgi:hypothetical protein
MANIILLLLIIMFIFAIMGITLFKAVLPYHFKDLGTSKCHSLRCPPHDLTHILFLQQCSHSSHSSPKTGGLISTNSSRCAIGSKVASLIYKLCTGGRTRGCGCGLFFTIYHLGSLCVSEHLGCYYGHKSGTRAAIVTNPAITQLIAFV